MGEVKRSGGGGREKREDGSRSKVGFLLLDFVSGLETMRGDGDGGSAVVRGVVVVL